MSDWIFRSIDRRFGLYIPDAEANNILSHCRKAGNKETGGVLFGCYSPGLDCANVTVASNAPPDSKYGRTWFYRGIRGLQAKIDRLWHKHEFYLGEWHFHPYSTPTPSPTDEVQMENIAASPRYHCPEPILLIIGGDPRNVWQARAWVYPKGHQAIELSLDG